MTNNEKALIALDIFNFLTYKRKVKLLNLFESPEDMFTKLKTKADEILKIVGKDNFDEFIKNYTLSHAEKFIKNVENINVKMTTLLSNDYPYKLSQISDPPFVLYYIGDLSLAGTKSIAIVGSRRCTRYGKSVTENFATALSFSGITIISGMAEGIDTIAMSSALRAKGKTIGVLGSGFNEVYPKSNLGLFEDVKKYGLVLTEYKPSTPPLQYNFPVRNRIIAALSDGVLITEASEKSGALHTKNYAIDYNKDLYVIPGNIDNPLSKGTNNILKTCQSAITLCPQDILENLNVKYVSNNALNTQNHQYSINQNLIIKCLEIESKTFDEISEQTKLDTKTLISELTILELYGILIKLPNNVYKLKS